MQKLDEIVSATTRVLDWSRAQENLYFNSWDDQFSFLTKGYRPFPSGAFVSNILYWTAYEPDEDQLWLALDFTHIIDMNMVRKNINKHHPIWVAPLAECFGFYSFDFEVSLEGGTLFKHEPINVPKSTTVTNSLGFSLGGRGTYGKPDGGIGSFSGGVSWSRQKSWTTEEYSIESRSSSKKYIQHLDVGKTCIGQKNRWPSFTIDSYAIFRAKGPFQKADMLKLAFKLQYYKVNFTTSLHISPSNVQHSQRGFKPLRYQSNRKLGVTVNQQNLSECEPIILHEGFNEWAHLPNGAIVLKDNPEMGLTVRDGKITDSTPVILTSDYDYWTILSNGAIVLKGNNSFGLTVPKSRIGNNAKIVLHRGYDLWNWRP